ncbi:hypothetical protein NEAUS04_0896 [Nematocida ausubeli]|uniref:PSP1 C-terminal domain-containing protein n=1 Tax=Nematocida ausubeli (strain ATCC PRA-371 / ERTm2) TaxID=1913371 RepID=H8ZA65_NEMA1|nr:uncharacterized protein NESG_00622 [Nematocida ausubeli]EHY66846.1 hypothetical protein NERG_00486 [Nematocida ausubeli]KAI5132219.1 hypothetical protein NEAUS06_0008 [Nematocida ausubeli]KAI5135152.1 hypothetical protein NEAUS07_1035 [Nematocida ausubeli]KAI5147937.1 hypothetical protein NEAUS05_1211 [Nematocida ausubeli]KAI5161356.1 hypothetical protein NEAUS03_1587 [Nematocida ausubeli]
MKDRENTFALSPFISDNIWSYMNSKDWKIIGNSFRTRSNSINSQPPKYAAPVEQKEGRKRSMSLNNINFYNAFPEMGHDSDDKIVSKDTNTHRATQQILSEKGCLAHLRRHSLDPSMFASVAQSAIEITRNTGYFGSSVCIVQFGSGGRCFGIYKNLFLVKGAFVIIEADRGEDCGSVIVDVIDTNCISELAEKYNIATIETKKIYRVATDKDKLMLLEQNELEQIAVNSCREKVKEKKLPMEIVSAEYQWDRNKLTFHFKSDKRIDFRELVKELYKTYKTRIWMCAVEKKGGKNIIYKHE